MNPVGTGSSSSSETTRTTRSRPSETSRPDRDSRTRREDGEDRVEVGTTRNRNSSTTAETPVVMGNSNQEPPSGRSSGAWRVAHQVVNRNDREADTIEVQDEDRNANADEEELSEFEAHAETLENYFEVFDNPGGGGTDGTASNDDIGDIASGDYDRDRARERLVEAGVDQAQLDETLDDIEATARYFDQNTESRDRVDGGDDGGDTDGKISRGDLDVVLEETRENRHRELSDEDAVGLLDEHFDVLDNPGGGGTDGKISRDDLEHIAEGDYDRDVARQRLREAGVAEDQLNATLGRLESTADHLLDDERGIYRDLDIANDGDRDSDGDIRRGDLDRYRLDHRPDPAEGPNPLEPSQAELEEAQAAYQVFQEPGALEETLEDTPLAELTQGELLALAQLGQDNPEAAGLLQEAVLESVEGAESLEQLPQGLGYQTLLADHLTSLDPARLDGDQTAAREHLGELVQADLDARLDELLDDRRGDSEADLAIDRFVTELEDLAATNPALGSELAARAEQTLAGAGDRLTDVRRADDSTFSKIGHAFTDGFNGLAGFLGDRLRDIGDLGGQLLTAPLRAYGEVADFALTQGGRLAGGALDAVGADGAADFVRDTSASAGDAVNGATDFVAEQQENLLNGFAEGAAGAVEGIATLVTNPVGTVQGLAAVVQDPSLLLESYKDVLHEHGVAGLIGNIGFDVVATIATGGSGAASRISSRLGSLANLTDDLGRLGRAGRLADTAGELGTVARVADDLGELGTVARVADDLGEAGTVARVAEAAPRPRSRRPLSEDELGVRQRANQYLDENLDQLVDEYGQRFGNILDLDNARELFDEFAASPEARSRYGTAIHEPSNRLIDEVLDRRLSGPVREGAEPEVVFTAGGSGSGKSSAIDDLGGIYDDTDFVFDSTLANYDRSLSRIEQVLESGRDVEIAYVYRDPVDAFVNGVLPRAAETGRAVPIEAFAASHQKVAETVARLAEHFAGDERFGLSVIDNSRGAGQAALSTLDDLPLRNIDNLTEVLYDQLELALQEGRIPHHVYDAILRERPPFG
ncbi:MAG: zeta toxin family protein [Vulcanimicrobiota bacterium]